LADD
jgi:hypothetical protein